MELADELPNEFPEAGLPEIPEDAEVKPWHDLIWRAWEELRYDRPYLPNGGQLPIFSKVIREYADQYGIVGRDFETFRTLLREVDHEWLAIESEKLNEQRREEERRRNA